MVQCLNICYCTEPSQRLTLGKVYGINSKINNTVLKL